MRARQAAERAYPSSPRTAPRPVGLAAPSRLAHLRPGLSAQAMLLLPAVLVGTLVAGTSGALAAAAGVAVVTVSFVASTLAVAAADARSPSLTLPTALGSYLAKFSLLGVLAFTVTRGAARWHAVAGFTVLAATLAWVGAQAWWFWTTPRPYVVLPDDPETDIPGS